MLKVPQFPYSTRTGIPRGPGQTGGCWSSSLPGRLFPKEHWRLRLGIRDKSEMVPPTEASHLALGSLLGVLGCGETEGKVGTRLFQWK